MRSIAITRFLLSFPLIVIWSTLHSENWCLIYLTRRKGDWQWRLRWWWWRWRCRRRRHTDRIIELHNIEWKMDEMMFQIDCIDCTCRTYLNTERKWNWAHVVQSSLVYLSMHFKRNQELLNIRFAYVRLKCTHVLPVCRHIVAVFNIAFCTQNFDPNSIWHF